MIWDRLRSQQRLTESGQYRGAIDGAFGPQSWAALLAAIARRTVQPLDHALGRHFPAAIAASEMDDPRIIAHFLAQLATGTGGFVRLTEMLDYSAARIMAVWPARFPTHLSARPYAHNPEALANKVYGGRKDLGNGPPASGDGWRYRGRGLIQLTGRKNYAARAKESGLPLIEQPELAALPAHAVMIAAHYWQSRQLTPLAKADDIAAIRKRINGGMTGLDAARVYCARAKTLLLG